MEQYKKKINNRIIWMAILTILVGLINVILNYYFQDKMTTISDFIRGFQVGIFCSLEVSLIYKIFKYIGALKDEKKLKLLSIAEKDERTKLIMQMTGAMGLNICYIGLAISAIIAGFINEIVFITLLGATIFTILVKGCFKLYYHYKF
jgi:hypothetical protein